MHELLSWMVGRLIIVLTTLKSTKPWILANVHLCLENCNFLVIWSWAHRWASNTKQTQKFFLSTSFIFGRLKEVHHYVVVKFEIIQKKQVKMKFRSIFLHNYRKSNSTKNLLRNLLVKFWSGLKLLSGCNRQSKANVHLLNLKVLLISTWSEHFQYERPTIHDKSSCFRA